MKALVFGEIIWDVYPEERVIGGAPLNFAAHMAHLGDDAYLVSAVGRDDLGEAAMTEIKKHGIKTDFIEKNGFGTGACIVTLDANGIPSYNVLTDTAYDNITADDKMTAEINSLCADMFYFNTLSQRNSVSKNALLKILSDCTFPNIFCDINLRKNCYDRDSVDLCLRKSNGVKISDEEGVLLYDIGVLEDDGKPFYEQVAEKYPNLELVVYTLGAKGSLVYETKTGKVYNSEVPKAKKVVSTVGAGDCYGATFASVYYSGGGIEEAIKKATDRSCYVVEHREAVPF